jgi:hypothetical protein
MLSSIHESIKPQVRHKVTAAAMYNVLKDFNGNTVHANGAIAWHALLRSKQTIAGLSELTLASSARLSSI